MTTEVSLFVDGSCRGNPGPGGCCAILQAGGREKALVDGADATTNNRMELTAVLTGLQALKRPCAVTVVTDSQYVAAILRGGQAKANRDLVRQVHAAAARHTVTVQWVAGHSGHALNERCDRLARAEATRRVGSAECGVGGGECGVRGAEGVALEGAVVRDRGEAVARRDVSHRRGTSWSPSATGRSSA